MLSIQNSFAVKIANSTRQFNGQKNTLAQTIGLDMQQHFSKSFADEGFTGDAVEPWKQVKRRIEGTPEWTYPIGKDLERHTRKILQGKAPAVLSNSIQMLKADFNDGIKVGTTVSYAAYHNTGTDKLPKRKFIGDSKVLMSKITDDVNKWFNKIFST